MSHELHQGQMGYTSFIDDRTGNRTVTMAPNGRVMFGLTFKIDKTSPGIVQGLGGDTAVTIAGGAVPVRLRVFGALADLKTGATITIGLDNVTSNHFLSSFNVADTGGGQQTPTGATNLWVALPSMPLGQLHNIIGHYTVAGTSTGGGPWYCELEYYIPSPA